MSDVSVACQNEHVAAGIPVIRKTQQGHLLNAIYEEEGKVVVLIIGHMHPNENRQLPCEYCRC
jgi:hypothetical protein